MFPSASGLVEESFRGGELSSMQSRRLEEHLACFSYCGYGWSGRQKIRPSV